MRSLSRSDQCSTETYERIEKAKQQLAEVNEQNIILLKKNQNINNKKPLKATKIFYNQVPSPM